MQLYVKCLFIITTMNTILIKVKEIFSFQQELSGQTIRLIANSSLNLKKLNLEGVTQIYSDIIHVIDRLRMQLTTLVLDGNYLTEDAYLHLNNCAR